MMWYDFHEGDYELKRNYPCWELHSPYFFRIELSFLHARMLCAKFGWNWLGGSLGEDFKILSMYFHIFIISILKGMLPFICIPFTQGCYVTVWLKVVLEKNILKFHQRVFTILLKKSLPFTWKIWTPFTEG